MTSVDQRKEIMGHLQEAVSQGARLHKACETITLSTRTYYRWIKSSGDLRPQIKRAAPPNKLNDDERNSIITLCNGSEFGALPPTQIVPKLADKGLYLGSESTFYRVLKENNQLAHRGHSKAKNPPKKPTTYIPMCQASCHTTYPTLRAMD